MRKAWCDVCGSEFSCPDDTEIGKIRIDSAYSGDITGEPVHITYDVCKCCLCYVHKVITAYQEISSKLKEE